MGWKILSDQQISSMIQEQVQIALVQEENRFEKELRLKQANLATLQSQINPHFLYNTLECIRGMALLNDQEEIADLAWSLSRFFRYSISGKSNFASLREEINNIQDYAKIQNYRFQNRFSLIVDEAESVMESLLPRLTLQPVVENAILHGLQDTTEGGIIKISIQPIGSDICLTISDNGCGMTPEALENLSNKIMYGEEEKKNIKGHTGIGMHNVDRRLKLYYGPAYGITVYSTESVGTDVEIRFPAATEEREQ